MKSREAWSIIYSERIKLSTSSIMILMSNLALNINALFAAMSKLFIMVNICLHAMTLTVSG